MKAKAIKKWILYLVLFVVTLSSTGCTAAWVVAGIAAGAAIGYGVTKDLEDGKLIDTPPKEQ